MSFARNALNLVLAPRAKPKPLDLGDLFNVSSGSSGSVEILSKVDAGASGLPVAQDAGKSDYSLDNGRVLSSPFESGKNGIVTMGMTNHPSSGTPKVTPGEAFKTIGGQSFTLFMRGGSSSGESGIHGSFVVDNLKSATDITGRLLHYGSKKGSFLLGMIYLMATSINSFLPTSKTSGRVTSWYDAVLVLFLNLFRNLSAAINVIQECMTLVHALFIGKDSIVPNLTPVKGQKMMTLKGNYNPIGIALVLLLLTSRVQAQDVNNGKIYDAKHINLRNTQHSSKVMTSESKTNLRTNKEGDRNLDIFNVAANGGTCGGGNIGNGICANAGECCSSHGWCGVTADHCGGSSTGGTCGSGNVGNGICANAGECCSSHGWCGVTAEHCGGSSTGGTCGSGKVGNGICANVGECCSSHGWCGVTADHCGGVSKPSARPSSKPALSKPTTIKPVVPPATLKPTSSKPTTKMPVTPPPTTSKPTSSKPVSLPATPKPSTSKPTLLKPTARPTSKPTTRKPSTPTSKRPSTRKPSTRLPSRKPTRKPTTKPTESPSEVPSLAPSDEPSYVPSQAPTQIPLLFDGIENAGSLYAGRIDLNWDFPSYDGEVPPLETVNYHVFSSVGSFNVSSALENVTIEELILNFQDVNNNRVQHHLVEGDVFEFSLNSTFLGELHTIFVIAEAGGVFSTNKDSAEIITSEADPIMKQDVNIVGVFIPTKDLSITITSPLFSRHRGASVFNKEGARNLNIFNVAANGGTCGSGNIGNGICANAGECCSSHGWCGTTAEHCGGSSTGGTCGSGNVGNGICANVGECCSIHGWCGVTADHCGGVSKPSARPSSKPASSKPTTIKPVVPPATLKPVTVTSVRPSNKPSSLKPTTKISAKPSTKPTKSKPTARPSSAPTTAMPTLNTRPKFVLEFVGPVRSDHQNLEVGDFVRGFTSEGQYFFHHIENILFTSNERVELEVVEGRLEDIYDFLDFEASAGISRPEKVTLTPSSTRRHRHLISRMRQRKLFCGWFCDKVEEVWNKGTNWITDRWNDVTDAVSSLIELIKDGQIEESLELVNIEKPFEESLIASGENATVDWSLAKISSTVKVRADLFVKFKVNRDVGLEAETGLRVEYSAELELGLALEIKKEFEEILWEGQKGRKDFYIGVVPVWVSYQPSLDHKLSLEVKATLGLSSFKAGVKGGAQISVSAGLSQGLGNTFQPPTLEPFLEYEISPGELSSTIEYNIIPKFTVELYDGILQGEISFPFVSKLEIGAKLVDINGGQRIAFEQFDISVGVSGGISIGTNINDDWKKELDGLFPFSKNIVSLPKANFPRNALHFCAESIDGARSAVIENIIVTEERGDSLFGNGFTSHAEWFLDGNIADEWSLQQEGSFKAKLIKSGVSSSSNSASGSVSVAIRPKFPPLPFPVIYSVDLKDIVLDDTVDCMRNGPCSEDFFDGLAQEFGAAFNSQVFLSQDPDPTKPASPSKVYKFEDFMTALEKLKGKENFRMWLGGGCGVNAKKRALVNIAAFLGQAMRETIIYDACDENNWDKWRADVFKEPTSPPEILAALYPMSSSCGQLGQSYEDYDCPDACPKDASMEITATTNAGWIGAPPPLFCGPKAKYDDLGYWNPMKLCTGPGNTCEGEPFHYPGQTAGYHFSTNEDPKYPNFYYANPLPEADGSTQPARFDNLPRTNVEGCCWWGRGVIQTTGRCNFGKLNKNLGTGAQDALYPDINFCTNPQALCDGPSELKWIAGIYFWIAEVESYKMFGSFLGNLIPRTFKDEISDFVDMGCADDPDMDGCSILFEAASGIVNRGCPFPGETGCSGCIPGATCGPAHKVPERVAASKLVLRTFLSGGNSLQ